jgi:hypothetical protein
MIGLQHLLQIFKSGRVHNNGTPVLPTTCEPPSHQTSLEAKQTLLAHHVRLVARQITNGLFVNGPGGLGKTMTIMRTLAHEGTKPTLLNSHITPLSLFQKLYDNRNGRIIFLDDADSAYSNMAILGLLRSALWGQGRRIVTYSSTQLPDNLPSSFEFAGRIIFCANKIPQKNEAFKAVLSRVDTFHLTATNDELIELMRSLAQTGYQSLSSDQCYEVVDFIEDYAATTQLSMRLYEPSLKKVLYAQERPDIDWRDLVRCQLDQLGSENGKADRQADEIALMSQAMNAFPNSARDQEQFWCDATSKSRASFFRLKRSMNERPN